MFHDDILNMAIPMRLVEIHVQKSSGWSDYIDTIVLYSTLPTYYLNTPHMCAIFLHGE
jgi:hypothetical protein